jgi:HEAT repeat protein
MRIGHTAVAILLIGVVAHDAGARANAKDPKQAKAEVIRVCRERVAIEDDIGGSREARLFIRIAELLEPGLVALADVAGSGAPEAECALNYLVELDDERAVPAARKILNRRRVATALKVRAIIAAGTFRDVASVDKIIEAFKRHEAWKTDDDEQIFKAAARALGRLPDARGRSVLNAALADTRYPKFQHHALIEAAGEMGNDEAIPLLQKFLADAASDGKEDLRGFVAVSLAGIGPRGRELAIRDLEGLTDVTIWQRTARSMVEKWHRQHREMTDAAERAEIARSIRAVESPSADPR